MTTWLEAPADEAKTPDLRPGDGGRSAKPINASPARPFEAALDESDARLLDARLDYLRRTHWEKVWRSLAED